MKRTPKPLCALGLSTPTPDTVCIYAPVLTVSELNRRDHWRKKKIRKDQQRLIVQRALDLFGDRVPKTSVHRVVITRLGERHLDAFDNLPSSMKAVVDVIAKFLGVDDRDARVTYEANQVPAARERGLQIAFKHRAKSARAA